MVLLVQSDLHETSEAVYFSINGCIHCLWCSPPPLTFPSLATPPPPIPKELKYQYIVLQNSWFGLIIIIIIVIIIPLFPFFFVSSSSSGSGRSFCNLPVCFSVDGWNGWDVVPRSAAVGLVAVEKKAKREKQSSRNYYVVDLSFTLPTVPYLPAQV